MSLGSRSHYMPGGGEEQRSRSLGDSKSLGETGEGDIGGLAPGGEILRQGNPHPSSIYPQWTIKFNTDHINKGI